MTKKRELDAYQYTAVSFWHTHTDFNYWRNGSLTWNILILDQTTGADTKVGYKPHIELFSTSFTNVMKNVTACRKSSYNALNLQLQQLYYKSRYNREVTPLLIIIN